MKAIFVNSIKELKEAIKKNPKESLFVLDEAKYKLHIFKFKKKKKTK